MKKWKQMEMVAALQDRQSAFIFSKDFMPGGRQNCSVKTRFIRNQSKQLVLLLCSYMCNQLRNDILKQKSSCLLCCTFNFFISLRLFLVWWFHFEAPCDLQLDKNAKGSLINIMVSWILGFVQETKNTCQHWGREFACIKRALGVANVTYSDLVRH